MAGTRDRWAPPKKKAPQLLRRRSRWGRYVPAVLLLLSAASLVLLITGVRVTQTERQPIVVLVVDASRTMDRTDIAPNRLAAAQQAAEAFVAEVPEDFRVGLVSYAEEPAVLAQPTSERERVTGALASPPRGDNTVIGEGLAAALDVVEERWQQEGRTDAALILLSDGLRTRVDSEHPVEVAARARELGIPIHTVVIGRPGTPKGPDIELMRLVTERSGGSLVTAESAEDLRSVYRNLGTQLSTDLSVPRQATLFIAIAVGFAIAAAIVLFVRS